MGEGIRENEMACGFLLAAALILAAFLFLTPTASAETIASGSSESGSWSIDDNGHLVISGDPKLRKNGEKLVPPWALDGKLVKSASFSKGSRPSSLSGYFENCVNLEKVDLSNLDSSKATSMSRMFYYCLSLTSVDLSRLDTSSVADMSYMFGWCSSLTSMNLSGFDTSKVTDMSGMFLDCQSLASIDVSGLDTSKVTDMSYMFDDCSELRQIPGVQAFDMSNAENLSLMFDSCSRLESVDTSAWHAAKRTKTERMFGGCASLRSIDMSGWTIGPSAFDGCSSLRELVLSGARLDGSSGANTFEGCTSLERVDLSDSDWTDFRDADSLFEGLENLKSVDFEGAKGFISCANKMFKGCTSLKKVDLSGVRPGKSVLLESESMFEGCVSLESADISKLKVDVFLGRSIFRGCRNLVSVKTNDGAEGIGSRAFSGCSSLRKLAIGPKVSIVESRAFEGCKKLKTLTVKSKHLKNLDSPENIRGCLRGSSVKTLKIRVGSKAANKRYAKKYKKIFTEKICGKKVTVKA